jgi:hypothetical protein
MSDDSMSATDFYVGQFPWIYLTYLAVLISPPARSSCGRQRRHAYRG